MPSSQPSADIFIIMPKEHAWVRGEYAEDRLSYLQQVERELGEAIADIDGMIHDLRMDGVQKSIERRRVRNEIADLKWRMR